MQMITPYRRYRRPSSLGFPFGTMMQKEMSGFDSASIMKTDIRETEEGFELSVELPGFSKDDVELELKDGYVIVSAQMKSETESSSETEAKNEAQETRTSSIEESISEEDTKGESDGSQCGCGCKDTQEEHSGKQTWVRRERFFGSCKRSFYMGEDIDEENISAKFENGILNISIPKKIQLPEPEQKKLIEIEG